MARLFMGNRAMSFFSDITKELMKDVAGHAVYYYPINLEKSDANKIYGESMQKVFDDPIYIEAMIEFRGDVNFVQNPAGLDKRNQITVYFHRRDMDDRKIVPKNGDFIQFGGVNYEVKKVTNPKLIYGHVEDFLHWVLDCEQARRGNLNIKDKEPVLNLKAASEPEHFTQSRGEQEGDVRDLPVKIGPPITGAKSSPFDGNNND